MPPISAMTDLASTRDALKQVAVHVLARRRNDVTGRFGLRAVPGGIGTPAFGEDVESLRIVGTTLLRERAGTSRAAELTTLRDAAELADVDLDAPFSVGHDTPALVDPDAQLGLDPAAAAILFAWYGVAATALDGVIAALGEVARPSAVQLWPEHFDIACDVAWGSGDDERVNLGCSPGDGFLAEPYAYVGPWRHDGTTDGGFWNAPFGATRTAAAFAGATTSEIAAFFREGVRRLQSGS